MAKPRKKRNHQSKKYRVRKYSHRIFAYPPKDNIKVTSVTKDGFCIFIKDTLYFCPYEKFHYWFQGATESQMRHVAGDAECILWVELDEMMSERDIRRINSDEWRSYQETATVGDITSTGFVVNVFAEEYFRLQRMPVEETNYFIPFQLYESFRGLPVEVIQQVTLHHDVLEWESLDIRLELSLIKSLKTASNNTP